MNPLQRAAFRLFASMPQSRIITHERAAPRGKGGEPGVRVTPPERQSSGRWFAQKRGFALKKYRGRKP